MHIYRSGQPSVQGRHKGLLAMDANHKLHVLNLEGTCLINKLNEQGGSVIGTFDRDRDLYTVSNDGSVRRWGLADIFGSNGAAI